MSSRLPVPLNLIVSLFICLFLLGEKTAAGQTKETDLIAIMDQPPYGFYTKEKETTGYLLDIGTAIYKKANIAGDIYLLPMKRLFQHLKTGRVDCTLLAATPFTKAHYRLIEPLGITLEAGIFPRPGIKLESYEDLKGLTIAIPRGVSINDRIDNDTSFKKVPTRNYRQSTLMLERGRVDALVGVWGSYLFNARELGFQPSKVFGKPMIFRNIPMWLVCRKDGPSPEMEEKLKLATVKLRENGTIAQFVERYLENRP